MKSRLPIVHYWDSGEPPHYLDDRLASFRELNPEMEQLIFSERTAADFVEEHFGPREAAAFASCAVPTMQSDYFRYCAIHVLGGVYADVGFRCLAPLRTLLPDGGGRLFSRGYLFSGLFLFAAAGHPLPRLVIDVATANVERRASDLVQMVTGPWILSGLSLLHRLGAGPGWGHHAGGGDLDRLRDPFCRRAARLAPTAAARRAIPDVAGPLFEAVGDYGRLAEAFEGVRITPFAMAGDWIAEPDSPLPYKDSDRYWLNWQRERSIFR